MLTLLRRMFFYTRRVRIVFEQDNSIGGRNQISVGPGSAIGCTNRVLSSEAGQQNRVGASLVGFFEWLFS